MVVYNVPPVEDPTTDNENQILLDRVDSWTSGNEPTGTYTQADVKAGFMLGRINSEQATAMLALFIPDQTQRAFKVGNWEAEKMASSPVFQLATPGSTADNVILPMLQQSAGVAAKAAGHPSSLGSAAITQAWNGPENLREQVIIPALEGQNLADFNVLRQVEGLGINFINESGILPFQLEPVKAAVTGAGGPTLADQVDRAALVDATRQLYQTYLMIGAPEPSKVVDHFVSKQRKNPNTPLDFRTFVKQNYLMKSPEWQRIYGRKPPGVSEEQYLSSYAQQVTSVLGINDASTEVTKNFAQFASTPDQVQGALRTRPELHQSQSFKDRIRGGWSELGRMFG